MQRRHDTHTHEHDWTVNIEHLEHAVCGLREMLHLQGAVSACGHSHRVRSLVNSGE